MTRSDRLAGVLSAGAVTPRLAGHEIAAAVASTEPHDVVRLATLHKVVLRAEARLRALEAGQAAEALSAAVRERLDLLRRVEAARVILEQATTELEIPGLLIKGLAVRELYADPDLREVGDLDLFVTHAEDAWKLAAWYRARRYVFAADELPWLKRDDAGELYGQLRLVAEERGAPDLDLHFGRYSIRHCAYLAVPTPTEQGLATIDPTSNLPLLLADAAGDDFISVKLLNDVYRSLSVVDWGVILPALDRVDLRRFLELVLDRLEDLYALSPAEADLVGRLRIGKRESSPPLSRPDWGHRCRTAVAHAYRLGRRRSLAHGFRMAATAARYYRRPLHLQVGRRSRRPRRPLRRMNPWTCVRLVPAASLAPSDGVEASAVRSQSVPLEGARSLRLVERPAGDLLVVGRDVFLPTVYYKLDAELARDGVALQELLESSAEDRA